MSSPHLIFDLDGTLIDSSPSILASMAAALAARGMPPKVELHSRLIGPPLLTTLGIISGESDPILLAALAEDFKAQYDSRGYQETRVMDGVQATLAALHAAGVRLFIVTNKRIHPTRLILAHLGWSAWFERVYAPDCVSPRFPSKAAAISALIADAGLDPAACLYIGDTPEDEAAARAAGTGFRRAGWGYGDWESPLPAGENLATPADLLPTAA
ncbi:MAG: hypothetical protein RIR00_1480 [Pseudomonadota bacterium]|jgi:phosphoglycolate phosphatase